MKSLFLALSCVAALGLSANLAEAKGHHGHRGHHAHHSPHSHPHGHWRTGGHSDRHHGPKQWWRCQPNTSPCVIYSN